MPRTSSARRRSSSQPGGGTWRRWCACCTSEPAPQRRRTAVARRGAQRPPVAMRRCCNCWRPRAPRATLRRAAPRPGASRGRRAAQRRRSSTSPNSCRTPVPAAEASMGPCRRNSSRAWTHWAVRCPCRLWRRTGGRPSASSSATPRDGWWLPWRRPCRPPAFQGPRSRRGSDFSSTRPPARGLRRTWTTSGCRATPTPSCPATPLRGTKPRTPSCCISRIARRAAARRCCWSAWTPSWRTSGTRSQR
mmetsp:Transcript_118074/g.369287  ORF Transcript_118074/g.369287 Transcript_118074/m.369287 type:complete len:248 (+) Transcript_118074:171-914(+)